MRGTLAGALMVAGGLVQGSAILEAAQPSIYTVAKYPVQAVAEDAAQAKVQALADGQQAAFRALLKRLVPVTEYQRIGKPDPRRVQEMLSGFSVHRETNSATEYVASLDFEFQPKAVRDYLRSARLSFVEEVAKDVVVVPVYRSQRDQAKGDKAWTQAWTDLDLAHALTPVKLAKRSAKLSDDTLDGLLRGDLGLIRTLASEHQAERILLAHASPSADGTALEVTLAGRDAVGSFVLQRSYKLLEGDLAYTAEYAAVVALGTLEGRWKHVRTRQPSTTATDVTADPSSNAFRTDGDDDKVVLIVEFRGPDQWRRIRQALLEQPGVDDLEVAQLTARGAEVSLRYSGGPERLAELLGEAGLEMAPKGRYWSLRAR